MALAPLVAGQEAAKQEGPSEPIAAPSNDFCEDAIDLGTGSVMVIFDDTLASSGEDGLPLEWEDHAANSRTRMRRGR